MFRRENRDEVIRLRVTKEEKDILKKFAKEKGLTMSAVVAQALDNYFDATAPRDFEKLEEGVKKYKDDKKSSKESEN